MAGSRIPGPLCVTTAPLIDDGTLRRMACAPPGPVTFARGATAAAVSSADESGLEIVLTPVQLAAVFANGTIEGKGSLGGRLWGGVTVIGGALELVGAGVLLLTPEPTMATKAAGGALGLHGLDTAGAGIRQVISGKPETTFTAEGAKAAAMALGADQSTAGKIGMGVDLGVPLLLGLYGAARIIAIRRGAISLVAEEAAGGHTLARHVGQTAAQLRSRLAAQTQIKVASTFSSLADAETCVAQALRANQAGITTWAKTAATGQRLTLSFDAGRVIGFGVVRISNSAVQMTRMTVVVQKVATAERVYFVLTAFPKP